jgi:predicted transglutaminase-like cysteine proteinase
MKRVILLLLILLFSSVSLYSGTYKSAYKSVNEELDSVLLDTLKKFHYVSDYVQYGHDKRVSFAKEVKEGKDFRGDCDDFAYTIRDILREKGHKVQEVIVRTSKSSGSIIHMVVKVDDKYMIDNRYPFVRLWEKGMKDSQYKFLTRNYNRLYNR